MFSPDRIFSAGEEAVQSSIRQNRTTGRFERILRSISIYLVAALLIRFAIPFSRANGKPIELDPIDVEGKEREPESADGVDTAFTTVIPAFQHALEGFDAAQALSRTVGVGARRSGGLGDYTAVLIRGSSAQQVGVFLDGVPISGGYGNLIDLSLFPLLSISRIEVFRSMLPAEFGSEGIGGAINLIPSDSSRQTMTRLMGAFGSYGLSRVGFAQTGGKGRLTYSANVSLESWIGDFPFYSDNGTPYNTLDDRTVRRLNNDTLLLGVLGWMSWQLCPLTRLSVLESFGRKDKGLPGIGHNQAALTRLESMHQLLDVKIDRRSFLHTSIDAMARTYFQLYRQRYSDPQGELGVGAQDQVDTSYSLGLIARFTWAPDMHNLFAFIPEWRFETYSGRDRIGSGPGTGDLPSSRRYRFGGALRDRVLLAGERLRLTPALRFDALYSDVSGVSRTGIPLQNSYENFLSPRLGVRVTAFQGLDIKGNIGRYFRPPTLMELFGDRGTAVGNPDLESEKSVGGDLGLVYQNHNIAPLLNVFTAQAAFFGRRVDNLIGWVQNSQRTAIATNIANAHIAGAEFSGTAGFSIHENVSAELSGNYTFLWTANRSKEPLLDGNRLPGRPLHEAYARLKICFEWKQLSVAAHYEVRHISQSFLDEANLFLPVPMRTLHDAGIIINPWVERITLAVTFSNIGNLRTENVDAPGFTNMEKIPRALADYGGFPLPGWTFHVALIWKG